MARRVAIRLIGAGLATTVALSLGACSSSPDDGGDDGSLNAFDDDENDELVGDGIGGKADGNGQYRVCEPIRSGKYALKGKIYTPTGLVNGYLVIDGEKIAEVRKTAPTDTSVKVIDTAGYIYPGLIDGHGHVEYNHVPLADLGRRYKNRDEWPNAKLYQTLVKDPKNAVTAAGLKCEGLKHGEVRALVGGTTAIQGTPQTSCVRHLVRNLEQPNFCQDKVRQNVMNISGFNRSISGKPSFADSVKKDIADGKLDAVAVHCAEGIDEHAREEWDYLETYELDVPELVMIHGAGLKQAELEAAAAVGAKMVWSPLSNMLLYGATSDVPTAMAAGVTVSLGADWAPSGSANLLWELKVADKVNKYLWNSSLTDKNLVDFVTINAAKVWALDKFIGSIEVGKYADLLVIDAPASTSVTPERVLIDAKPKNVKLVAISGDALFGDPKLLDSLGKQGDYELIDACGVQRAIDVTVTAADVSKGKQKLSEVEAKLVAVNPKLTPVIDCENDEMVAAFKGTSLEGK
ncbi:MAG: amidohydrolase family protein [Polyangiaceae bacterium]|nr:amidohydrolase family protein [Polyangiaceae bacterium]